jgi:hypothetical protein
VKSAREMRDTNQGTGSPLVISRSPEIKYAPSSLEGLIITGMPVTDLARQPKIFRPLDQHGGSGRTGQQRNTVAVDVRLDHFKVRSTIPTAITGDQVQLEWHVPQTEPSKGQDITTFAGGGN